MVPNSKWQILKAVLHLDNPDFYLNLKPLDDQLKLIEMRKATVELHMGFSWYLNNYMSVLII